jgi:hypothetical protein
MRTDTNDERGALMRAAAELGPGYRGRRRDGAREERLDLARRLEELGERPPDYLEAPRSWIDREGRLFEAGSYPDKRATLDASDLAALAERFDLPVPVLIEHAASPLEIGYLTAVRADGPGLTGTFALTPEANALIERSGARGLSLGLSPDLKTIREVSLVRHPRVASAALFSEGPVFEGALDGAWRDRIAGWVREGRLSPAQAPIAEALLALPGDVRFGEDGVPVADLVARLIEAGRGHGLFRETAPDPAKPEAPMDGPEAAFYARYFPGLDLAEIAKRR